MIIEVFFLIFVDFIFKKVIMKENAVPIWHFFSTVPKCLGAELCFSTGAEMSWCRTVLVPHLMYQWQFSSNIWILWLRHLMNKWQFAFNVCLLCVCPQTELACVDKKMYRFFLLLLIVVLFDFLNIRNIKISNKTVLHICKCIK